MCSKLMQLRQREQELLRQIGPVECAYIRTGMCGNYLDRLERRLAKLRENIVALLPPIEHKNGVLVLRHLCGRTAMCPFCGTEHRHSPFDGHVDAHCCTHNASVTAPDGTILHQRDGYILQRAHRWQ